MLPMAAAASGTCSRLAQAEPSQITKTTAPLQFHHHVGSQRNDGFQALHMMCAGCRCLQREFFAYTPCSMQLYNPGAINAGVRKVYVLAVTVHYVSVTKITVIAQASLPDQHAAACCSIL
jgi:hypothetical protein